MMASFSLNTGHERPLSGFCTRTSDVFASLAGLEKTYDDGVKQRGPDEFEDRDRDNNSPERDGDGGFKRPAAALPPAPSQSGPSRRDRGGRYGRDAPRWRQRGGAAGSARREGRAGKRSRTPDHELHPERWTEYSLEETDISGESANKRAAVDFFRELRERKGKEMQAEKWDAGLHCGKIEFKRPAAGKSGTGDSDSDPDPARKTGSFGDVHKMPEYVIGQGSAAKARKSKRPFAAPGNSGASKSDINLGHLGGDDVIGDRSSESSDQLPEELESQVSESKQLSPERGTEGTGDGDRDVDSRKDEGEKKESVGFKKGKAKRKIRERRDDDD